MKSVFQKTLWLILLSTSVFWGCTSSKNVGTSKAAPEAWFVQLNDVYEIAPIQGGQYGGMARVATLIKSIRQAHPNTTAVLAGDFLSPSVIGTCKLDGKRIYGAQMVDAMNLAGIDWVTFGNHEFDIPEADLLSRLKESHFRYLSTNTFHQTANGPVPFQQNINGQPENLPRYTILEGKGPNGKAYKLGVISATLPFNQAAYVQYEDMYEAAAKAYEEVAAQTDGVVALTHLSIDQDRELARRLPGLLLIMGGHEHEQHIEKVGKVVIAKADANAKTAYIHKLTFLGKGRWKVDSEIKTIDNTLPQEPITAQKVAEWEVKAYKGFLDQGFDLKKTVTHFDTPMDGTEVHIRTQPTNFGKAIAEAMAKQAATPIAVFNSGSVRIDDYLQGDITEFDLIRALPFGGGVVVVEMKGDLLIKTLDTGLSNTGSGGYLQYYGVEKGESAWLVNGQPLKDETVYSVALTEFLFSGKEANLGFLSDQNPDVLSVSQPIKTSVLSDIRLVLIAFWKV